VPLLLVMGLASQMLMWETDFCELLAARGFRVIRYDNRDVGQSTILRGAPTPKRWQLALRDPKGAPYSLQDMAGDAVGLLDHLQIPAAHVVGASMGGMIAQALAIGHPDRVLSLVSIMSTTGNRRVGRARPRLALRMLRRVAGDRDGYIRDHIRTYREIGSPAYSFDEATRRELAGRMYDRGIHPAGGARQMAAIVTTSDRTADLQNFSLPTTVIHGDVDPLVNVSGGRATAAAIPGARLMIIPGMGHDLSRQCWPQIADAIAENTERASAVPDAGA
jgi:pimeloyl-ACP methyl ester carboxylesterase